MNLAKNTQAIFREQSECENEMSENSTRQFTNQFADLLKDFGLGFARTSEGVVGSFAPCPISFTPWVLSQSEYRIAVDTAKSISRILEKLSSNENELLGLLEDFSDESSLIFKLKRLLEENVKQSLGIARNFNLSRFDFMLDLHGQWKLVESNTVAAGMGPFSQKLGEFHQSIFPKQKFRQADNPAIEKQAKAMFNAAVRNANNESPNIIFVIEPNEDNIFDQNFLVEKLTSLGAKVIKQSLYQLYSNLKRHNQKLSLDSYGDVDLIYFRTGYNLEDYNQVADDSMVSDKTLLELRAWIERHQVTVSPSLSHQLASSKWIQIKLSKLSPVQLKDQFQLSHQEAERISKCLNTNYKTIESFEQVKQDLESKNWLLKNQSEGGGNIKTKISNREQDLELKKEFFLMEKIESQIRSGVCSFNESRFDCNIKTITELGIFTAGEAHQYAGYLARSKPSSALEGGVHAGEGFLDLVVLKD